MDKKATFSDTLEKHRGERHLVILHDFPDPDAISSAYAHKLISAQYDIEVNTTYMGKISHSQNIALVKLLAIELLPYHESVNLSSYQGAVFLDNQIVSGKRFVSGDHFCRGVLIVSGVKIKNNGPFDLC